MLGYQFAHVETWSVAGASGTVHHGDHVRPNGQKAWTAAQILDEAERRPGSAFHVDPWGEPPQVLAGQVADFDDLRAAHAAASTIAETFDYTNPKTRRKSRRTRKLRKDARTLYAAVFSLPVETAEARADPLLRERCLAVLEEAIDHERKRIERAGGRFMMGVAHWDEGHVHAHFYALDPVRGRVNHLHPGAAAKDAFVNDPRNAALTKKDRNAGGDRAYCEAMRDWQRTLHDEVFKKHGLLRVGPRRERLSRADYLHAKEAAAERREDRERRSALNLRAAELEEFGAQMLANMEQDLAAQREWNDELDERSKGLTAYEAELLENRRRIVDRAENVERREGRIEAREAVLSSREGALVERERAVEGRERDAVAREAAAASREKEADAALAAIEAVAAGAVEIVEVEGRATWRPSADAGRTALLPGFVARMRPKRDVAHATLDKLGARFAELRATALEVARREARRELAAAFGRVSQVWESVQGLQRRLLAFAGRLPPEHRRELDAIAMEARRTAAGKAAAARDVNAAVRKDER